jgi:hypothetical protein
MNNGEKIPVWIRLPRPGDRCPFTGLSRSFLAELVRPCDRNNQKPPVAAKKIDRKGSNRGVILVNLKSLLDYINSQPSPKVSEKTLKNNL